MLRPRQFSLLQLLISITGIAVYLGFVRYLFLSGHGEWVQSWLTVLVTTFIGSVLVAMGVWSTFHAIRQILYWPKASARIERYCMKRSEDRPTGQPFYHPVLRFQIESGQPVTTISHWGSWRRSWRRGDTVIVRYNPADPRWAEIATFANVWGMPLTFLALATLISVLNVWFR